MRTHVGVKGGLFGRRTDAYLEDLKVKNYSLSTIQCRRLVLELLVRFLKARHVFDPRKVKE